MNWATWSYVQRWNWKQRHAGSRNHYGGDAELLYKAVYSSDCSRNAARGISLSNVHNAQCYGSYWVLNCDSLLSSALQGVVSEKTCREGFMCDWWRRLQLYHLSWSWRRPLSWDVLLDVGLLLIRFRDTIKGTLNLVARAWNEKRGRIDRHCLCCTLII